MSEPRHTRGTKVVWTSQAGGFSKTKRGTVLVFVPAGVHLGDAESDMWRTRQRYVLGQLWSSVDRYLVAVPRGGKSTIVDYYTPYASLVKEDKTP